MGIIDMWNWWRARKVALIVKRIKKETQLKKPLWVFTLSWQKGWQHGQDAVMMNDAGADLDLVMIYECNNEQFARLVRSWNQYLSTGDARVLIGNQIDWVVHQNTLNPTGTEEYYRRMIEAAGNMYGNGVVKGAFIHDLSRVLWGRKGPYSSMEWLVSGAAALSKIREDNKTAPFKTYIVVDDTVTYNKPFEVNVNLSIIDETIEIHDLKIMPFTFKGMELFIPSVEGSTMSAISLAKLEEDCVLTYSMNINQLIPEKGLRYMVAAKVNWKEGMNPFLEKTSFAFKCVGIKDYPLISPSTSQTLIPEKKNTGQNSMD